MNEIWVGFVASMYNVHMEEMYIKAAKVTNSEGCIHTYFPCMHSIMKPAVFE